MRAIVIKVDVVGLKFFVIIHWPRYIRLILMAIIRSIDAVAFVKK